MEYPETVLGEVDAAVAGRVGDESPGLVLLVALGDRVIYRRAHGMADVEAGIPLEPRSRLIIGSVTKQFTGMAAMMLSFWGLLDLDEPVARFFPGFPPYVEEVTPRHLLTHTSGIREYLTDEFWRACSEGEGPSAGDVLDLIKGLGGLEFAPGTRWSYSNSGYVMLGAIIEAVSGTSLAGFLADNVFTPLGMGESLAGTSAEMVSGQARGYTYRGRDDFEPAPYHTGTVGWADGNIISTVDDLLIWARSLDSAALLPRPRLAEAYTPVRPGDRRFSRYGFGHVVGEWRGIRMIHHGGGTLGYVSRLSRFPDAGLTVAMLSNAAGIDLASIEGEVVRACLGHIMAPVPRVEADPGLLASLAGVYAPRGTDDVRLTLTSDRARNVLTASGDRRILSGDTDLVPVGPGLLVFDDPRDFYLEAGGDGLHLLMHGHVTDLRRVGDDGAE